MTAAPLLDVQGLGKTLGGRVVLSDVALQARAHELVAVLGPSGAGKTTLLRCLAGLLQPDAGTVRLHGAPVSALRGRARRQIAVVFQQFNLVARLSVADNVLAGRLGHVAFWRGWLRAFGASDRRLADACLERVGLAGYGARRADTLSGGQQQRVAIARALAQQPRLIVADEPVAGLDPGTGAAILALLRDLARGGPIAVVCSLHQVGLARDHADRIVGLSGGRIAVDGPAAGFGPDALAATYRAV